MKSQAVPAIPLDLVLKLLDSHCIIRPDLVSRMKKEAKPMRGNGFVIITGVEGGVVQGCSVMETQDPNQLDVYVNDYDCQGSSPEETISYVHDGHTSKAWSYDGSLEFGPAATAFVQTVLEAMGLNEDGSAAA